ncbi:hypothetical protein [Colwellia sp. MB02u-9]|uniref:hypothetical protein n=1 Tax=Colwellia sp. MB02u-9 TaxID=2759823 RepID=UPI0015F35761|nr:hypothetical protein [Colwellia sp. MB02u-9]MBA6294636.1 hypothetical protein [Colwellia sp. MB02u-9]
MSKKKGMFSWLGLGKKQQEDAASVVENVTDETEQAAASEEHLTTDAMSHEEKVTQNNQQTPAKELAIDNAIIEDLPAEPEPKPNVVSSVQPE